MIRIKMLRIAILVSFATSLGCVGPLVSHETARTVGDGNSELVGGYGSAGLVLNYDYGVNKNFDVGVHYESLSFGLKAKYAFVNQPEAGWSWAVSGGLGATYSGTYYNFDFIGSYLVHKWEPYGTLRLVHVKTDPVDVKDNSETTPLFTISSVQYNYGQIILGTRYWFTEHWLLSAEASTLVALGPGLDFGTGLLLGAAFGYRF
jgi:hypothetical protein